MLLIASILLLVIIGESYCKTTVTVNQTSSSWGYNYSHTDTSGYKVNHNQTGYHYEPYNNPSSSFKKHYNSSSVYDQFTSPGTNTSIRHSNATNYVINGISNRNTDFRANSTVSHKELLDSSADKQQTTGFRTLPIVKTQTVTVTETRAPTGPMYYPQAPTYGQTYGPVSGSMYRIPNGQMNVPPPGPLYGSTYGQQTSPMNGNAPYGYGPQNGPMYGPQNGATYGPQNGPMYGPQNGATYGPQNGPMYGPQNGQIYGPEPGQGYPTGSLYGSHRNY